MTNYSRQDVLRIFGISARQLHAWERVGLVAPKETYSFQEMGQLRTLRELHEEDVSSASIRASVSAMRAVSGMNNPLLESAVVHAGARLLFRHHGAIVDPIRRQLLFDFERVDQDGSVEAQTAPLPHAATPTLLIQDRFLAAVEAEENGQKLRAVELYEEILSLDPHYAPAAINLGTIHFHMRQYEKAEKYYRMATEADPSYVLAFFDLGNVLDELERMDESIDAYKKAVALAPYYADAHYNLAMAYERKGSPRNALRHWQAYLRLDAQGAWAEHAREQIRKLLNREKLSIAWRSKKFIPRRKGMAALKLA